jgi:surface antigen
LAIKPRIGLVTGILIGVAVSGCSVSRNDDAYAKYDTTAEVTGSISATTQPTSDEPTEIDLAFARNAASDVLTKGDKDSSQPWENPATGARGSVTPLASAYTVDGRQCRHFLASYVRARSERWLQGEGCRSTQGRWEIHSVSPWRKS